MTAQLLQKEKSSTMPESDHMLETTAVRKHKIALADYDYKQDIENRLLLSHVTLEEYAVIEELLFSPIRTTLRKISKSIDLQEDRVLLTLQKLEKTGLISFEEESIVIDKEARKYFETELEKFQDDFQAGMEFLQHLLRKVPIHALPHWYAIPRMSNNIFDSLIERYLLTPAIYQRYLTDLNFPDPALNAIVQDVLKAPNFEVTAQEIQKKYNLTPEKFQEAALLLEFHFVCVLAYRKQENGWSEVMTLFQEWKDHLTFLRETTAAPISESRKIQRYRPTDFAFVEDMASILLHTQKWPAFLEETNRPIQFSAPIPDDAYLKKLLLKIEQIQLAELQGGKLILTDAGLEWLHLQPENKALYLYRHPLNQLQSREKVIREVEKSTLRIINVGWVKVADFLKGVCVPISEGQLLTLKKTGKTWKYQRPSYSADESKLIKQVILEHLFEAGMVALGSYQGELCMTVTPFGQSLFG
jgi:hypothetical protein